LTGYGIDVIAVDTGDMIPVLLDDAKAARGGVVSLATGGNGAHADELIGFIEVSPLFTQADANARRTTDAVTVPVGNIIVGGAAGFLGLLPPPETSDIERLIAKPGILIPAATGKQRGTKDNEQCEANLGANHHKLIGKNARANSCSRVSRQDGWLARQDQDPANYPRPPCHCPAASRLL